MEYNGSDATTLYVTTEVWGTANIADSHIVEFASSHVGYCEVYQIDRFDNHVLVTFLRD